MEQTNTTNEQDTAKLEVHQFIGKIRRVARTTSGANLTDDPEWNLGDTLRELERKKGWPEHLMAPRLDMILERGLDTGILKEIFSICLCCARHGVPVNLTGLCDDLCALQGRKFWETPAGVRWTEHFYKAA